MNLLAQSAFLKALGWALLHSLWQMGALWLIYTILTADGKRFSSRQRYNMALLLVSTGTILFLSTLAIEFYELSDPIMLYAAAGSTSTPGFFEQLALRLEPALPLLSVIYLVVIALLFVRFFRQYYFSHKLIRSGIHKADPDLRMFLEDMVQRFGINKKIRIGLSELVNTPLTLGFWKPVILLPVAAVNHLSIKQTEAIILHELNHIKQNDYLVNLLIACLDIVLFFNPFSRMMSTILVKERENSCDDLVLQFRYPACEYAKALLLLEQTRATASPILAMRATGDNKKLLLNRVQRILYGTSNARSVNYRMVAFVLSAFLIAFTGFYNPAKVITRELSNELAPQRIALRASEVTPVFTTVGHEISETPAASVVTTVIIPAKTEKEDIDIVDDGDEVDEEDALGIAHLATTPSAESMPVLYSFTTAEQQPLNYSIQESTAPAAHAYIEVEGLPYVPATSFSYHFVEDTTFPKRYIQTANDVKAKEDLEKALKALEEIDWDKIESELSVNGKKVDVTKLQAEIRKALNEVDWKKINEDVQSGRKLAEHELLAKQAYLKGLQKFQKEKLQQQQSGQQMRNLILTDRLHQNAELKKCEDQKKQGVKAKKIVVI
jgi:beta-lactamase regulating signal transducer with metallopeptidase domain